MDKTELRGALVRLPDWKIRDNRLYRKLTFKDFKQAFSFMSSVAKLAEEQNHHPNWYNCYNIVEISLYSHDIDELSERDFELATAIDQLAQSTTA